jgi:hypothetical protein
MLYQDDFESNPQLMNKVRQFIDRVLGDFEKLAESLYNALQSKVSPI